MILEGNATHTRMAGVPREAMVGRFIFDVFPSNPEAGEADTEAVIRASVARVVETRAADEVPLQRHDLPLPHGGFEHRWWRMIHSPVIEGGRVTAIRQDAWDVTAQVQREQRAEALQRAATAISNMAFWEFDPATDRFTRSPELDGVFGFAPEEAGPLATPFFARLHPDDLEPVREVFADLMAGSIDTTAETELRAVRPDGTTLHMLLRAQPAIGRDGRRTLIGTTLDVTELRRHERELAAALDDKDVLLAEVNHRVKNSLQLVSSILAIGARTETDPSTRAKLTAAAERVRAVAAVHSTLYHSDDVRTVDLGAHLRAFLAQIADGAGLEERDIHLVVDVCDATVPTEKAVPISLIVNELVTNALKYAFPGRDDGLADESSPARDDRPTITVSLTRHPDATLALTIADNGVGGTISDAAASSERARPDGAEGLGSRLVPSLAAQIGAELEQSHDQGWSTRITFAP